MKRDRMLKASLTGPILFAVSLFLCPSAQAVPSFTRQTGLQCNVCHNNPPELSAFGRKFKLDGYTLTDKKAAATIEAKDLAIRSAFPLSVKLLLSTTAIATPVPGAQKTNTQFPQDLSLFLAGAMAPHLGGMIEVAYSHESDHVSLDMTDIRYADHTTLGPHDLLYGLTLNNSPTLEDVWNSTPTYGYPWLSPENAPSPNAQPLIAGALAQDVAGLGAYAMWNDHLYAAVTLYRSEHAGGPQPLTGTSFPINIQGVAPYWRIAWQQTWGLNYLELGTYGINLSSVPGGVTGLRDTYADTAVDLQYERPFGVNLLTCHTTFIHEHSKLDATFAAGGAGAPAQHLNALRADATYHLRHRYTFSVGGFSTAGSADPLLYPQEPVSGSALGRPNSTAFAGQVGFWPQQNVELSVAYTGYTKFNGRSSNYDSFGRSASANNSLYLALWLNF